LLVPLLRTFINHFRLDLAISEYSGDLVDPITIRNETSPYLYYFEKGLSLTNSQWIDGATTFGIAPVLNHSGSPNCVARCERVSGLRITFSL
jgi:hypothetical protein